MYSLTTGERRLKMQVSKNGSWYKKAENLLMMQLKTINDASNEEMSDRYQKHCEIVNELEKLERWYKMCSTSSHHS